jgi:GntR family transcriptional regulator
VRRALADLTAEGLLMRRRRSGTVVTGRAPQHSLRFFFRYFRLHGADGTLLRSTPEVLARSDGPATPVEAAGLDMPAGNPLVRIHRLRRVAGRPVMHERIAFATDRVPGFPLDRAAVPDLLYLHLLERHGIRIAAVRERVSASLADPDDVRLLDLEPPAAVLVIDETAYDQKGTPVLLTQHRATTNGYVYLNEIR